MPARARILEKLNTEGATVQFKGKPITSTAEWKAAHKEWSAAAPDRREAAIVRLLHSTRNVLASGTATEQEQLDAVNRLWEMDEWPHLHGRIITECLAGLLDSLRTSNSPQLRARIVGLLWTLATQEPNIPALLEGGVVPAMVHLTARLGTRSQTIARSVAVARRVLQAVAAAARSRISKTVAPPSATTETSPAAGDGEDATSVGEVAAPSPSRVLNLPSDHKGATLAAAVHLTGALVRHRHDDVGIDEREVEAAAKLPTSDWLKAMDKKLSRMLRHVHHTSLLHKFVAGFFAALGESEKGRDALCRDLEGGKTIQSIGCGVRAVRDFIVMTRVMSFQARDSVAHCIHLIKQSVAGDEERSRLADELLEAHRDKLRGAAFHGNFEVSLRIAISFLCRLMTAPPHHVAAYKLITADVDEHDPTPARSWIGFSALLCTAGEERNALVGQSILVTLLKTRRGCSLLGSSMALRGLVATLDALDEAPNTSGVFYPRRDRSDLAVATVTALWAGVRAAFQTAGDAAVVARGGALALNRIRRAAGGGAAAVAAARRRNVSTADAHDLPDHDVLGLVVKYLRKVVFCRSAPLGFRAAAALSHLVRSRTVKLWGLRAHESLPVKHIVPLLTRWQDKRAIECGCSLLAALLFQKGPHAAEIAVDVGALPILMDLAVTEAGLGAEHIKAGRTLLPDVLHCVAHLRFWVPSVANADTDEKLMELARQCLSFGILELVSHCCMLVFGLCRDERNRDLAWAEADGVGPLAVQWATAVVDEIHARSDTFAAGGHALGASGDPEATDGASHGHDEDREDEGVTRSKLDEAYAAWARRDDVPVRALIQDAEVLLAVLWQQCCPSPPEAVVPVVSADSESKSSGAARVSRAAKLAPSSGGSSSGTGEGRGTVPVVTVLHPSLSEPTVTRLCLHVLDIAGTSAHVCHHEALELMWRLLARQTGARWERIRQALLEGDGVAKCLRIAENHSLATSLRLLAAQVLYELRPRKSDKDDAADVVKLWRGVSLEQILARLVDVDEDAFMQAFAIHVAAKLSCRYGPRQRLIRANGVHRVVVLLEHVVRLRLEYRLSQLYEEMGGREDNPQSREPALFSRGAGATAPNVGDGVKYVMSDEVVTDILHFLLNATSEDEVQPIVGKYALELLLHFTRQPRDHPGIHVELAQAILSNVARHPQNRSQLYKIQLRLNYCESGVDVAVEPRASSGEYDPTASGTVDEVTRRGEVGYGVRVRYEDSQLEEDARLCDLQARVRRELQALDARIEMPSHLIHGSSTSSRTHGRRRSVTSPMHKSKSTSGLKSGDVRDTVGATHGTSAAAPATQGAAGAGSEPPGGSPAKGLLRRDSLMAPEYTAMRIFPPYLERKTERVAATLGKLDRALGSAAREPPAWLSEETSATSLPMDPSLRKRRDSALVGAAVGERDYAHTVSLVKQGEEAAAPSEHTRRKRLVPLAVSERVLPAWLSASINSPKHPLVLPKKELRTRLTRTTKSLWEPPPDPEEEIARMAETGEFPEEYEFAYKRPPTEFAPLPVIASHTLRPYAAEEHGGADGSFEDESGADVGEPEARGGGSQTATARVRTKAGDVLPAQVPQAKPEVVLGKSASVTFADESDLAQPSRAESQALPPAPLGGHLVVVSMVGLVDEDADPGHKVPAGGGKLSVLAEQEEFVHIDGAEFCRGLYGHRIEPDGRITHVLAARNPRFELRTTDPVFQRPIPLTLADIGQGFFRQPPSPPWHTEEDLVPAVIPPNGKLPSWCRNNALFVGHEEPATKPELPPDELCKFTVVEAPPVVDVAAPPEDPGPPPEPFDLDKSVFAPRKQECPSKDYYDTARVYNTMFRIDWSRCWDKSGFQRTVTKHVGGNMSIVDSTKSVLKKNYRDLVMIFDHFCCCNSDQESFCLLLNAFSEWLVFCHIPDPNSDKTSHCKLSDIDGLFVATNYEEKTKDAEKKKLNEANQDRALMRTEFLEIIVRIAMAKFARTELNLCEAVTTLLNEYIFATCKTSAYVDVHCHDKNKFRETRLYTREVNAFFEKHLSALHKLFSRYCPLAVGSSDKMTRLPMEGWIQMLSDCGMMDASFTNREARLAFSWSRMAYPDELKRRQQAITLTKTDFLEAIARVAEMKWLPTDDQMQDAGIMNGDVYVFFRDGHHLEALARTMAADEARKEEARERWHSVKHLSLMSGAFGVTQQRLSNVGDAMRPNGEPEEVDQASGGAGGPGHRRSTVENMEMAQFGEDAEGTLDGGDSALHMRLEKLWVLLTKALRAHDLAAGFASSKAGLFDPERPGSATSSLGRPSSGGTTPGSFRRVPSTRK